MSCNSRIFESRNYSYAFWAYGALLFALFPSVVLARQLVWSDEFEGSGAPDPLKWGYELGFVRNKEPQWYTNRLDNARVENGFLVLEARKEKFWDGNGVGHDYTSASLMTKGKFSWLYGRIEVRALLPEGDAVWPAIWTLGDNIKDVGYPLCGELDIMEYYGNRPGVVFANIHFYDSGRRTTNPGVMLVDRLHHFHVYAMEWSPKEILFYVDGYQYHSFRLGKEGGGPGSPFHKPHYLLINLALQNVKNDKIMTSLPARFLIDYVRVYN